MKKYVMEFTGTMFFVLCIIGIVKNGVMTLPPLYIGLTLAVLIYIGAHVSGSHYNPAVTFSLWLRKKIQWREASRYVISQLLWAFVAYFIAQKVFHYTLQPIQSTVHGDKLFAIFVAEFLFTFALITAVFHTAVSKNASWNSYFGLAIGWVVIIWAMSVGSISGWFFNPAVLFGLSFYGNTVSLLSTILLAHIVAAFTAANFYSFTAGKE